MSSKLKVIDISIQNIKNVNYGTISFEKCTLNGADIIGIYGQNGSGKTALVNGFEIIQILLSGDSLPDSIVNYISVIKNEANIAISFDLEDDKCHKKIFYEVKVGVDESKKPQIIKETLKLFDKSVSERKIVVYECDFLDEENIFLPLAHLKLLTKSSKVIFSKLLAQKLFAKKQKQSLLFSDGFIACLKESNEEPNYIKLLCHIQNFARMDLFVIKNSGDGILNISSLLPVSFRLRSINEDASNIVYKGNAPIIINEASDVPEDIYNIIKNIIEQMNIVLSRIIPHLQIDVVNLGEQLNADGQKIVRVEYVSKKNGQNVPLRNESEGIRKIISMLGAIINFYNRSEAVTIIDEMDSGIFEYLLGELLEVLQEGGRGQLLFTSHNLRPLEKLNKDNLYFTTCNENNRYVKLTNVKPNNNLRDFYYRVVQLGGQSETLYETTNLEELSIALSKAGQYVKK
jgi:hypothetical protein